MILPELFSVEEQIYECQPKINESDNCNYILSAVSALPNQCEPPFTPLTWAATKSLLSKSVVPKMQVAFLPFIPKPVTDYSTVYTALKKFNVLFQLEQEALPVFCDEGVYRIVVDVMLNKPNEFTKLIPFLGGFRFVVRGSGLDDGLIETEISGEKSIETVFGATNYVRSFCGLLIVESSMNRIKWIAFNDESNENNSSESAKEQLNLLQEALASKSPDECKSNFEKCVNKISDLMKTFNEFEKIRKAISQICAYFEEILDIAKKIKSLIAADRNGNWEAYLQAVQELIPISAECHNIHYFRYGSYHLEFMRKLPEKFPTIFNAFKARMFVVCTSDRLFSAVSPDMKLEQKVQRSQKSMGGIISQTNQQNYVTKWEIVYHEILSISNVFKEITNKNRKLSNEFTQHHELEGNLSKEIELAIQTLVAFITRWGNPYSTLNTVTELYNISTGQIYNQQVAERYTNFSKNYISNTKIFAVTDT